MRKLAKSLFDFLLFSNMFMAFCAVAQARLTFYLVGSKPVYPVLIILFTATLGIYSFSAIISKPVNASSSVHFRVRWFFGRSRLMMAITIVSFLALAPLFFFVSLPAKVLLICMTVLSIGYSVPLFTIGYKKFGLRQIPGLKPFLITFVWTLSCVLLPIIESTNRYLAHISFDYTSMLLLQRFLFIGALTIPYDVRDLYDDRQSSLKTIPVAWGEKNAYLFCQVLLGLSIVPLLLFHNPMFDANFWALLVSVLLTGWLILKSKWEKNEYYYFFLMDSVLITQYLLVIMFSFFAGRYL